MKKRLTSPAFYFALICIVLMGYMIYLNVTPYWTITTTYIDYEAATPENNFVAPEVTNSKEVSIQGLFWFTRSAYNAEMDEFERVIRTEPENRRIQIEIFMKDYITLPIIVFLAAAVGIILCLLYGHSLIASICPLICGIGGMIAYSSNKLLLMFENKAADHKQFCMYIAIAGAIHLVLAAIPVVIKFVKKMQAKKAAAVVVAE